MSALRLLIIDDETSLLDLLRRYLERLGYIIEGYSDPQEALTRFASEPQGFAMVITDLILPGTTGEELLEQMRKLNPNIRALVCSGYPFKPQLPNVGFLQKPYQPKALAAEVEKTLQDLPK